MKRKIKLTFLALLFACSQAFSQSPNMINYQGVAMSSTGTAIANQTISIRATVHQATANGTILFSEERSVLTDATGLFNFQLGDAGASATTGSWTAINWDNGNKFLEIEMDATGGTNFITMGTQQLVSVPYAQYANKAGALIPAATINANQINPSGATTNQVLKYNGSNWVPSNDASAFSLPYSASDSSSPSFKIINTKAVGGNALRGECSGSGTTARAIYGIASGSDANAIYGNASGANGIGVFGNSSGSNGIGVEGYTNNINGRAIKGIHASNGIAIEGITGTGYAVYGECTGTSGTGIVGKSNGSSTNSRGVYGESLSGTGVTGYSNNMGSVAVFGSSLAGTGVKAYSYTGKALEVNGDVKISGGNTNPSDGAILTSDATGNAVWKMNNIGFVANYDNTMYLYLNGGSFSTIPLMDSYDAGNSFNNNNAATDPNTFIAPVSGLYSFSSSVIIYGGIIYDFTYMGAALFINGNSSFVHRSFGLTDTEHASIDFNQKIHLNAGDKVVLKVRHDKTVNTTSLLVGVEFSGVLVFAD